MPKIPTRPRSGASHCERGEAIDESRANPKIASAAWPVARDGRRFGGLLWKLRIAIVKLKANSCVQRLAKTAPGYSFLAPVPSTSTRSSCCAAQANRQLGERKMKVVQIEMMLSRAEASALRSVLDEYVKAIQYLESNQPQNLPEHSAQERDAIITALTAVENALQQAPAVIDGMGELLRLSQDPTWTSPAFTLAAAAATEH